MTKRKKKQGVPAAKPQTTESRAPVPTKRGFQICLGASIVGLIAQLVMAAVAYGSIPREIPSGWIGWAEPGGTIPSWVIFVAFPGAQLIILLLALVSAKKNDTGERVIDSGRAVSLVLLTIFFILLQSSAFLITR